MLFPERVKLSGIGTRPTADAGPDVNVLKPTRATTIVITNQLPDFGCLGIGPTQDVAACVVGQRTTIGDSKISVDFVPLGPKSVPPDPITLVDQEAGLVVGHLRPSGETEDRAQLRRKACNHSLEIGLEETDLADLDGEPE